MKLQVSPCGHFFRYEDGSPFFYLGDTAWLLFNKLKEEEVRVYFRDRAEKGFTVVQSVIFRDLFTPNTPNAYGDPPFADEDDMYAVRMNPRWIDFVKKVVPMAAEYNLVMGLLPTWGDKWNSHSNSAGPIIMDKDSARDYGRFLSDALAGNDNIIWILGGDSPIQTQEHADTIAAMAEGIRSGGSGDCLMTFHPSGMGTSDIFHTAGWLDFNAIQTSHYKPNIPGYLHIERMYSLPLAKPCLDMEPNYELSPMFIMGNRTDRPTDHIPSFEPIFSDYDVRKSYYRTVLAGGAGFTYGCEPIRQFHRKGDKIHIFDRWPEMPTWDKALSAPGSSQLQFLIDIFAERSYFSRKPAQELFLPFRQYGAWPDRMGIGIDAAGQQNTDPVSHIKVAACSEGSYIIAYCPVRQVITIDTSPLKGGKIIVSIYDPEKCKLTIRYTCENTGVFLTIPQRDLDTLIVLDAAVNFR